MHEAKQNDRVQTSRRQCLNFVNVQTHWPILTNGLYVVLLVFLILLSGQTSYTSVWCPAGIRAIAYTSWTRYKGPSRPPIWPIDCIYQYNTSGSRASLLALYTAPQIHILGPSSCVCLPTYLATRKNVIDSASSSSRPRYHLHTRWTLLLPLRGFGRATPHASPCQRAADDVTIKKYSTITAVSQLSLIHIWRCRRSYACRSRWSPYH